jgi:hypothetical protein
VVRTTAVKKPRTERGCQPVAFKTANMLAPCFRFSITSTKACFGLGFDDSFLSDMSSSFVRLEGRLPPPPPKPRT